MRNTTPHLLQLRMRDRQRTCINCCLNMAQMRDQLQRLAAAQVHSIFSMYACCARKPVLRGSSSLWVKQQTSDHNLVSARRSSMVSCAIAFPSTKLRNVAFDAAEIVSQSITIISFVPVRPQFRRSVADILQPQHDDYFLLRWLNGMSSC